jgi:hypothetical protein
VNFNRKPTAISNEEMWQTTSAQPNLDRVDLKAIASLPNQAPSERSSGNWAMSSADLMRGVDITEMPATLSADLFDRLFSPTRD